MKTTLNVKLKEYAKVSHKLYLTKRITLKELENRMKLIEAELRGVVSK